MQVSSEAIVRIRRIISRNFQICLLASRQFLRSRRLSNISKTWWWLLKDHQSKIIAKSSSLLQCPGMDIKCLSWNAHSLHNRENFSSFSRFVEYNNFKIIFVSETWCRETSNIRLAHFHCYRVNRDQGGVAFYVHKTLPHTFHNQFSSDFGEAVSVKLFEKKRHIILTSVYCSPRANKKQSSELFSFIFAQTSPVLIAGDLNAKHQTWNNISSNNRGLILRKLLDEKQFNLQSEP